MATLLKTYTGSTAIANTNAFYVVAELYSENEWLTGGHYLYVNYYVYVSDGQDTAFTKYCRASWKDKNYKFSLSTIGKYAETRVDIGWTGYGATAKISSANAWYEGSSETIYKSTLSEQVYTVESCQHTVKYDANGGTGAPSSQTKTWGVRLDLHTTKPTRTGYTFKTWNTKADGSGTSWDSGANYTPDQKGGTVTLYAQWQANEYKLTINPNGGKFTSKETESTLSPNLIYDTGSHYKVALSYRTGYTFVGYADSNGEMVYDETGHCIKGTYWSESGSEGTYIYPGDLKVYAQWEPNKYTLTLLKNDGSSEYTTIEVHYDSDECADLSSVIPDRLGYKFLGWFADTTAEDQIFDENGICLNDGTYFTDNCYRYAGDLTLLAYWEPLNIAYYKVDGVYTLCFTYYKENGEWKKAILYKRINDTYERSIVNE